MNKRKDSSGVNTGAAKKDDYWYFGAVAVPLFNEETSFRPGARKPVTYALFGQLFLAPMMLPHHNAGGDEDILKRQQKFLEEYGVALRKERNIASDKLGRRAEDVLSALREKDGSALLEAELSNTTASQPYAIRSSSYAAPERYLSFYMLLEQKGTEAAEPIRTVEELYRLELELIFANHMDTLVSRLRYLLGKLPEAGAFAVPGGRDAADQDICSGAGRILSCALLWAAAERVNNWEVYELLHRRFGMPEPASTGAAARAMPTAALIPFSSLIELCSALSEEEELSPRTIQALLPLVEPLPPGVGLASLEAFHQAVSRARRKAYHRAADEEETAIRQQLSGRAAQLDQMEGELKALLQKAQKG